MNQIIGKTRKSGKRLLIRAKLHEMAIARGPEAKLPTRDQLCADLGTSPATIDDALRDLEAANVICRRQGSGIFVSPKLHCKNIRVLMNAMFVDADGVSPFWGILWGKLVREGQRRAAFRKEDIRFELVASGLDTAELLPPDVLHGIETGGIHGVLSVGMNETGADWSVSHGIPLVSYAGPGYWQIVSSREAITTESVRRLVQRGCRRIGLWHHVDTTSGNNGFLEEGRQCFMRAITENGLVYHPELHRLGVVPMSEITGVQDDSVNRANPALHQDQGYQAAMRTFSGSETAPPDGLVIYNDMMASGGLMALYDLGIRPGRDIQITAPANIGSPVLYGYERYLLLWQVDPGEIAREMFGLLDRLMAGEAPAQQFIVIPQRFPE